MLETIRIIIVDAHPLTRAGMQFVLSHEEDIQIVGEASSEAELLALVCHLNADVILLDLSILGMEVLELVHELGSIAPTLKIVIVSAYHDEGMVQAVINAGVQGYFLKEESTAVFASMIRTVSQGATWFSAQVMKTFISYRVPFTQETLSPQEISILQALSQGASNLQIARQLHLASQTIRNYSSRIYEKLGITSRAQAVAWAYQNGFGSATPDAVQFPAPFVKVLLPVLEKDA